MSLITDLEHKRAQIHHAMTALLDRADREPRAALTPDEASEFDRLTSDLDTYDQRLQELRDQEKRENDVREAMSRIQSTPVTGRHVSTEDRDLDAAFRTAVLSNDRRPIEVLPRQRRSGWQPGVEARTVSTTSGSGLTGTTFYNRLVSPPGRGLRRPRSRGDPAPDRQRRSAPGPQVHGVLHGRDRRQGARRAARAVWLPVEDWRAVSAWLRWLVASSAARCRCSGPPARSAEESGARRRRRAACRSGPRTSLPHAGPPRTTVACTPCNPAPCAPNGLPVRGRSPTKGCGASQTSDVK